MRSLRNWIGRALGALTVISSLAVFQVSPVGAVGTLTVVDAPLEASPQPPIAPRRVSRPRPAGVPHINAWSDYEEVEVVGVDDDGSNTAGSYVMRTGHEFRFIATGQIVRDYDTDLYEDAEYQDYDGLPSPSDDVTCPTGVHVRDIGAKLNDTVLDGNAYPDWGSYTGTHIYTKTGFPGTGAVLTTTFHQCDTPLGTVSSNNLAVAIHAPVCLVLSRIDSTPQYVHHPSLAFCEDAGSTDCELYVNYAGVGAYINVANALCLGEGGGWQGHCELQVKAFGVPYWVKRQDVWCQEN